MEGPATSDPVRACGSGFVPVRVCRTPAAIVIAGGLVWLMAFGPRAATGVFQVPMTMEFGWSREVFSLATGIVSARVNLPIVEKPVQRSLCLHPA